MDPDACFSDLLDSLARDEYAQACDHAENLLVWLDSNGFIPGGGRLRASSIRAFCVWAMANYQKEV